MANTDETATGSEYILEAIAAEGVETVFGIIGEGNAHLIDAMNDHDLEFSQARHEQAAVSMADGHARTVQQVSVCTLTHGPGLTNGATGIAAADRDNVPLVVLVGDTSVEGRETSLQYLDHQAFAAPITRYTTRIERPKTIPETLSRAFDRARTRSGPVVVEIPEEIQEREPPESSYRPVSRPSQRPRPDDGRLAEAVSVLEDADEPMLLAGGGALRSDAGEALETLAEHLGAPIATTYFGRGVLPDAHPMVSGIAGTFLSPANDELAWDVDVLVAVGARLSGKTTRYGELYADTDVIQIDLDREGIGAYQQPAVGIVADARAALEEVTARLDASPDRASRVADAIESAPDPWADGFEKRSGEIDPREFTMALSDRVPDDSIVAVDSGNNTGFPAVFHDIGASGRLLVNGNFGTMGYALPAALGAKAAAPDRPVVCYIGDGATLQVIQEIETGVRLGLPIVLAVLNDRSYGIIRHRQNLVYERETASSYDSPAYADIARGFGAKAATIRSADELDVVDDYLDSDPDVPLVLDVRTIPEVSRPGFPPY
ncbi:thiamine pyrophosphate-binding protein [Salinadaptatus halalkaliphilus]|uniref:Thiamine pyrophosphate-binding protein n=1 Tax=Salinadaptatus halalkaliphilus TaxID=2419781 RepID=A0A4S3TJG6_9EURY|nr:thiamine pyrophosphate-binding protein [Salinadaptatus halalkaliphilus]THE64126.1 thiamine pyrophosphate-binding protein [Salinadaptatus halalkaliphilus]